MDDAAPRPIWQLTEDVLELFRSRSRSAVHARKKPESLWLDDLTGTQSNTVIAVRQLCDENPEGVTLKRLAETMGVTPAAASVMVDLLVKRKMLKRTKSRSDRRAVVIRLTPDTAALFDVSEQTLHESVAGLEEALGPQLLLEWQRILLTVNATLRQMVAEAPPEGTGPAEPSTEGDAPAE
jgi:DNA-binding MarR family transcriptional regulator